MQKSQLTIYETYTRFTVSSVYRNQILLNRNNEICLPLRNPNFQSEMITCKDKQKKSVTKSPAKAESVESKKATRMQSKEGRKSRKNMVSPDVVFIRPCKRQHHSIGQERRYNIERRNMNEMNDTMDLCQLSQRLSLVTFKSTRLN
jgi:hypothetical protein